MQRQQSRPSVNNGVGAAGAAAGAGAAPKAAAKNTLSEIQRLEKERYDRRKAMEQVKQERLEAEARNRENGTPGDVDFQKMIKNYRAEQPSEQQHKVVNSSNSNDKICICVRKRPISMKEIKKCDYDSVTCLNPLVTVHDCKLKVDGISKYLESTSFQFDQTFHEDNETNDIYKHVVQPLVDFVVTGGRATVFAYGQTGSGKTYTMEGIQSSTVEDLYKAINANGAVVSVFVSYFEIYGGRCQDLLNNRNRLNVREDGNGDVVVSDLFEIQAADANELQSIITNGNRNRTTHATESNDVSSRSHAICQIGLRNTSNQSKLLGKFSLIDLAGSERGADTNSHNRQRRLEGAEINKSLLALKECIRALDSNNSHVPYRASKLTLVLKDSFTNKQSKTVMIATVSPAASSADHTLNTLRYADRIKERVVGSKGNKVQASAVVASASADVLPSPPPGAAKATSNNPPSEAKNVPKPAASLMAKVAGSKDSPSPPIAPSSSSAITAAAAGKSKSSYSIPSENKKDVMMEHNKRNSLDELQEEDLEDEEEDSNMKEFHQTVQDIYDEEEALLNLHMNVIQENAELLTEEGRLLQRIQSDDGDIDTYASKLEAILERKQQLILILQTKLSAFRGSLVKEEIISMKMSGKLLGKW